MLNSDWSPWALGFGVSILTGATALTAGFAFGETFGAVFGFATTFGFYRCLGFNNRFLLRCRLHPFGSLRLAFWFYFGGGFAAQACPRFFGKAHLGHHDGFEFGCGLGRTL